MPRRLCDWAVKFDTAAVTYVSTDRGHAQLTSPPQIFFKWLAFNYYYYQECMGVMYSCYYWLLQSPAKKPNAIPNDSDKREWTLGYMYSCTRLKTTWITDTWCIRSNYIMFACATCTAYYYGDRSVQEWTTMCSLPRGVTKSLIIDFWHDHIMDSWRDYATWSRDSKMLLLILWLSTSPNPGQGLSQSLHRRNSAELHGVALRWLHDCLTISLLGAGMHVVVLSWSNQKCEPDMHSHTCTANSYTK